VLGYKAEALLKLHKPEEADVVLPKALDVERTLAKLGITPQDSFILMVRAQVDLALGRYVGV
jgi:DnaJ family protein C protein 7